jgi:hypothetical protein
MEHGSCVREKKKKRANIIRDSNKSKSQWILTYNNEFYQKENYKDK